MSENKICGNCIYCVTHEGPPYYCALRDLYYLVSSCNQACADYVPAEPVEETIAALLNKELKKLKDINA